MTKFSEIATAEYGWHEFLLHTLALHWLTATIMVILVGLTISLLRKLNATTRHNIWLLTLVSFVLMPLLIFAPRFEIDFSIFNQSIESNDNQRARGTLVSTSDASSATDEAFGVRADEPINLSPDPALVHLDTTPTSFASGQIPVNSVIKGILIFWLVGVVFLTRRLWNEYRAARELELQSDSVTPYFERRFDQLCSRLGLEERPLLRFHAGINAPMTVGLVRVWVAIPMNWRETIDDNVFDQTLTHELGHIARKDPMIHTLQRLLGIVFWMYPAVWYVCRQLEVERESACDDWVLMHDGQHHTYASNLLDIAESMYLQPSVLAVGCLRSHSQLSQRIKNLLNKSSDHKTSSSWKLLSLTMVGLFATLSVSAVVWPDVRQLAPPAAPRMAQPPVPFSVADVVSPPEPLRAREPETVAYAALTAEPDNQIQRKVELAVESALTAEPLQPQPPVVPPPASVQTLGVEKPIPPAIQHKSIQQQIIRNRNGTGGSLEKPNTSVEDPLLYAARTGNIESIEHLLSTDSNILSRINQRSSSPHTPLEVAIINGHLNMLKRMIALGVDLSANSSTVENDDKSNPLTVAVVARRYAIAKLFLQHNISANSSTLLAAVQNNDARMIDLLLSKTQCDCLDPGEAILLAVQNRDLESLNVLLKHDANVDHNAIAFAVQNDMSRILSVLLKQDDVDIDDSLLNIAILNRNKKIIDLLLKFDVEPAEGALTLAIQQGNASLVRRLLERDAEIEEGAMVMAVQQRNAKMVRALVQADAPVSDGAIAIAIQQGNQDLVRSLLRNEPSIEDGSLIMAIQLQKPEIVALLLDAGAVVSDGVLLVASQSGNQRIMQLIRQRSGRSSKKNTSSRDHTTDYHSRKKYSSRKIDKLAQKNEKANRSLQNSTEQAASFHRTSSTSRHELALPKEESEFYIARWPVRSHNISLGFNDSSKKIGGHDKPHEALDFPMKTGSPVYAVAAGYVKKATYSKSLGNYILIDHDNGYETKYANNQANQVEQGDYVKAYEQIAVVGSTAHDSTKPHLHFELRQQNHNIDPESLFTYKR